MSGHEERKSQALILAVRNKKPGVHVALDKTPIINLGTAAIEIQNMIFENLYAEGDRCTATCLALTCTQLWEVYCTFYPDKTSLTELSTLTKWNERRELASLLYHWFWPHYRVMYGQLADPTTGDLGDPWPTQFLNTAVYGLCNEQAFRMEQELKWKWKDFRMFEQYLPSPFNKGDAWYPEAAHSLKEACIEQGFEKFTFNRQSDVGGRMNEAWRYLISRSGGNESCLGRWLRAQESSKNSNGTLKGHWGMIMAFNG